MAYLHLGRDVAITTEEVVAILDLESWAQAEASLEFLAIAKEEGFIQDLAGEKAKSLILATKNRVFLSPISSWTLQRRADLDHLLSNEVGYKLEDGKAQSIGEKNNLPD